MYRLFGEWMSRSPPFDLSTSKGGIGRSLKPCKREFLPFAVSYAVRAQQKTPQVACSLA